MVTSKLLELVLYVAEQSATDPDFGMVKLNKILFNADFSFYGATGQSISGEVYQKAQNGPIVRQMKPTLRRGEEDQDLIVQTVARGPYPQQRVVPRRLADLSYFSAEEISYVDQSINLLRGMTATRVSDLSHDFPGWILVPMGHQISYESVLISREPLTQEEHDWPLQSDFARA